MLANLGFTRVLHGIRTGRRRSGRLSTRTCGRPRGSRRASTTTSSDPSGPPTRCAVFVGGTCVHRLELTRPLSCMCVFLRRFRTSSTFPRSPRLWRNSGKRKRSASPPTYSWYDFTSVLSLSPFAFWSFFFLGLNPFDEGVI